MGATAVHYLKKLGGEETRCPAFALCSDNYITLLVWGSTSLHTEDMVDVILSGIGQVINVDHITLNPVNADIIPHE